jgi:hypothetical protein
MILFFDFELEQKKLFQIALRGSFECVKIAYFDYLLLSVSQN